MIRVGPPALRIAILRRDDSIAAEIAACESEALTNPAFQEYVGRQLGEVVIPEPQYIRSRWERFRDWIVGNK